MDCRIAGPDDAEGIARAHVAGWQWGYRGLMPDDFLDALSWTDRLDRWMTTLRDPGLTTTQVAVAAGVVHGFVLSGPARDLEVSAQPCHEIYSLYIDRSTAGTGVGSTLLRLGIDRAAPGARGVTVWVLEGNTRARAFYRRHGFTDDGASKEYEFGGLRLSDVRMRLSLD